MIAPLPMLASWANGRPATLVFCDPLGPFVIAGEGETTWFGGLLVGVYLPLALTPFFAGSA